MVLYAIVIHNPFEYRSYTYISLAACYCLRLPTKTHYDMSYFEHFFVNLVEHERDILNKSKYIYHSTNLGM